MDNPLSAKSSVDISERHFDLIARPSVNPRTGLRAVLVTASEHGKDIGSVNFTIGLMNIALNQQWPELLDRAIQLFSERCWMQVMLSNPHDNSMFEDDIDAH